MEHKKACAGTSELRVYRLPMEKLYVLVSSLLLALAAASCTEHAAARPDAPVIPVMAAKAEEKAMPIELHEIGTGEAYSTVSIESQVAGIVSAVHYTQGQFVKKGDLLVSLDDRPFAAALEVARAKFGEGPRKCSARVCGSGAVRQAVSIGRGAKGAARSAKPRPRNPRCRRTKRP